MARRKTTYAAVQSHRYGTMDEVPLREKESGATGNNQKQFANPSLVEEVTEEETHRMVTKNNRYT